MAPNRQNKPAKPIPTSRLARASTLGAAAAGQAIAKRRATLSMIGRSAQVRARLADESVMRSAEQLVLVLGSMKGVAMKLGQMLSILDLDLVPPAHRETFQRRLALLRDSAPTVAFEAMREVVETDLGASLEAVFAEFDPTPVAAASIGQVYRARLRDGRDVAVKVQYPGVDAAVRADLKNLVMFRKVLAKVLPWMTPAVLDEFRANIASELDYEAEARTQAQVAATFADHPFIAVPTAYPELSGPRVLVAEYFPAVGFDAIRELPQAERNQIGEIIYRFYVGSLFSLYEFCGDPHPGNVLLGVNGSAGRVGFIDFGLFNRMDPRYVEFEATCLRAAAEGRDQDLYRLMVDHGVIDAQSAVTPAECYDYVMAASEWCLVDEELAITPDLASGAFLLALDPRAGEFTGMKSQNLPPEHLFSRRADFLVFGILGQLGTTANWHRIAREWLYGDEPVTELGKQHQAWLAQRARKSGTSAEKTG